MRVQNEKELYKLIPKNLRSEYKIGMHGFGSSFWKKDENGKYVLDDEKIKATKERIMSEGLKIAGERLLLSTVNFENINGYISTSGFYEAGGVIVALPKHLESDKGRRMFLGSPNEKSAYREINWDRNREATSVGEVVLVEGNTLPSMFILGTYSKDNDGIEVDVNQSHFAYGKQVISDDYFKEIESKTIKLMRTGVISSAVVKEMYNQKLSYRVKKENSILSRISGIRGSREGKKEVGKIFSSWLNRTKEREESKEDGIK